MLRVSYSGLDHKIMMIVLLDISYDLDNSLINKV